MIELFFLMCFPNVNLKFEWSLTNENIVYVNLNNGRYFNYTICYQM
jgi:hypothetical protein